MAGRPRKTTRLTVSLEAQDHDAVAELALAKDVSLSWIIRQAVRQFIEQAYTGNKKGEEIRHARTSDKT